MLLFNKPTAISYISKSGDKIYPVVIDIKEGVKSSETLSFMTADSNTGILSVAFMDDETIYNIDDATVVCDIERPDGTDLSIGAVKVADGVVEVPLGVNGTSQPGMYMFDFKIVRPGSKTIGVPLVSYTVTQSINTDEIVAQDDRLPVLNDLVIKIQNATSASTQATNECKTATNNVNNTLKSVNNAIASGTVDLELKQVRTSLNGTLHPTANDRINQMETHLLEATATTVETESNFTTVEATNNGYFEDIKLKGKTLVNLANISSRFIETTSKYYIDHTLCETSKLDLNKSYTFVINCNYLSNHNTNYNYFEFGGGTKIDNFSGTISTNARVNIINMPTSGIYTMLLEFTDFKGWEYLVCRPCRRGSAPVEGEVANYDISVLLLEGDHTNNPPEFFEGLMSVGQDIEEVSVASVNENLFDLEKWIQGVSVTRGTLQNHYNGSFTLSSNATDCHTGIVTTGIVPLNERCKLINVEGINKLTVSVSKNSTSGSLLFYGFYDKEFSCLGFSSVTINNLENTHIITNNYSNAKYLMLRFGVDTVNDSITFSNILVLRGDTTKPYVQHQSNKKPLLYFNPTAETWEKPILREWDTIEKHSDGKYYYHQRSEEVDYISGDESLTDCITDMNKTVKKISTEKVYECTNIDLMTYSGETNYIINSGTISPKSLLKVYNNIANVVKILQEKVNLLENTFIAGLKSVLSGDMYSLATILYPEDFEQNDNTEQDIMVIPE